MSDVPFDGDEAPTVEVRLYRQGELIHRELCQSEEQADLIIEAWSEMDGVSFEVDDLSARHTQGENSEPEAIEAHEEDYAEQAELDRARPRRYD